LGISIFIQADVKGKLNVSSLLTTIKSGK
jgi:hypothetical protein